jgi:WD40 repeat protein
VISWDAHRGRVWSVAFAPDGSSLASFGADRRARVWGGTGAELWHTAYADDTPEIGAVAFSRDGRLLAVGAGNAVGVFDAASGSLVVRLVPADAPAAERKVDCVVFTPDGLLLACGAGDNDRVISTRVVGWEVGTWAERQELGFGYGGDGGVWMVVFAPDGRRFAWTNFSSVDVMDYPPAGFVAEMRHDGGSAHALAFSRQGREIAFSFDATLWVVDLQAMGGEPADLFMARGWSAEPAEDDDHAAYAVTIQHRCEVNGAAYTPGGLLMTAGGDGGVRYFDPKTGAEVRSFDWGVGPLSCSAVSPDGMRAAAGGEAGKVVVWDVDE